MLSSRHPDQLKTLAKELGMRASVGTPEQAAQWGDVILLSIPTGEIPKLSQNVRDALIGKIVMDSCNPFPDRDGEYGVEAQREVKGSGVWATRHLPGAKIVKAFNTVYFQQLADEAHRQGDLLGVPLAGDDKEALRVVAKLVQDAGLGPLVVGDLKSAKQFDNGTPAFVSGASVHELEEILGLNIKSP